MRVNNTLYGNSFDGYLSKQHTLLALPYNRCLALAQQLRTRRPSANLAGVSEYTPEKHAEFFRKHAEFFENMQSFFENMQSFSENMQSFFENTYTAFRKHTEFALSS